MLQPRWTFCYWISSLSSEGKFDFITLTYTDWFIFRALWLQGHTYGDQTVPWRKEQVKIPYQLTFDNYGLSFQCHAGTGVEFCLQGLHNMSSGRLSPPKVGIFVVHCHDNSGIQTQNPLSLFTSARKTICVTTVVFLSACNIVFVTAIYSSWTF